MSFNLRANTSGVVKIGPFVDSSDGNTVTSGLVLSQGDVRLSKNGGDMAQKNDANPCTHDELGYYSCPYNVTDTDTEGTLLLAVHETGALPVRHEYNILAEASWDSMYTAKDSGYMDVNVNTVGDTSQTANDNGLDINSILALLDDARTEPGQEAPPVNPDMATKVDYLYKFMRNKITNNGTGINVYADNGSTIDHISAVSETSGVVTRGEFGTGA